MQLWGYKINCPARNVPCLLGKLYYHIYTHSDIWWYLVDGKHTDICHHYCWSSLTAALLCSHWLLPTTTFSPHFHSVGETDLPADVSSILCCAGRRTLKINRMESRNEAIKQETTSISSINKKNEAKAQRRCRSYRSLQFELCTVFKNVPLFYDLTHPALTLLSSRTSHELSVSYTVSRTQKKRAFMAALERCYQRCPSQIQRDPGAAVSPMI